MRKKQGAGKLFYMSKEYWVGFRDSIDQSYTVRIPTGFSSDIGSVPWFLQGSIGLQIVGSAFEAYIVHDYLYWSGIYTRKFCDDIFLAALKEANVSYYVRYKIYWGVRVGGWVAWNKHRKRDGKKHD